MPYIIAYINIRMLFTIVNDLLFENAVYYSKCKALIGSAVISHVEVQMEPL